MIVVRDVAKRYRPLVGRSVRALEQLSLEIGTGEVVGIAGPNGAGKSTLLSLILGFLPATTGELRVGGLPPRRYVERHGVGYAPEAATVLPRHWTTRDAMRRCAALSRVPARATDGAVADAVHQLGLAEHLDKRVRALSKGTLQRLVLAQALLGAPQLYVFDEPTSGLDPLWVQRFRALAASLRAPDRTILVASHDLGELERIADRVVILDRGRVQRVVQTRAAPRVAGVYRVAVVRGAEALLAHFPAARLLPDGVVELTAPDLQALNDGLARAIAAGALVESVAPLRRALEDEYRAAVGVT